MNWKIGADIHTLLYIKLEKEMATHSSTQESHGGRSLVGYSPWGRKESDMTERLHFIHKIDNKNPCIAQKLYSVLPMTYMGIESKKRVDIYIYIQYILLYTRN